MCGSPNENLGLATAGALLNRGYGVTLRWLGRNIVVSILLLSGAAATPYCQSDFVKVSNKRFRNASLVTTVSSLSSCKAKCERDRACGAFEFYWTQTTNCHLYTNGDGAESSPSWSTMVLVDIYKRLQPCPSDEDAARLCNVSVANCGLRDVTVNSSGVFIRNVSGDLPAGTKLVELVFAGNPSEVALSETELNSHITFDADRRILFYATKIAARNKHGAELRLAIVCMAFSLEFRVQVVVTVDDVNDRPPVFEKPQYMATLSEESPVGTTVISRIVAVSDDPANVDISYRIVPGEHSEYFQCPNASLGEILLAVEIDGINLQRVSLTIEATETSTPERLSTRVGVEVAVTSQEDIDNNPTFNTDFYRARMAENASANSTVVVNPVIYAWDPDHPTNPIIYSLDPLTATNFFSIDRQSGVVTLIGDVRTLGGSKVVVPVKATQARNMNRHSLALLTVSIISRNDHDPEFVESDDDARVQENTPADTAVLRVMAKDADAGSKLTYRFFDLNTPAAADFIIDKMSGLIQTFRPLRFSRTSVYKCPVEVSDGQRFQRRNFTLHVDPVNVCAPVFSQEVYHFEASGPRGNVLGVVQASDENNDKGVSYRIALAQDTTIVTLDSNGTLRMSLDSDNITNDEYELLVEATDNDKPPLTGQTVVVIRVPGSLGTLLLRSLAALRHLPALELATVFMATMIACLAVPLMVLLAETRRLTIESNRHRRQKRAEPTVVRIPQTEDVHT